MEPNHCTAGRILVVIAHTAIVTSGYESLPRASASIHITPHAPLLPKYILGKDPKQSHSPHRSGFAVLRLSSGCLGEEDEEASREWEGVGLMAWLLKSLPIPSGAELEVSHSP